MENYCKIRQKVVDRKMELEYTNEYNVKLILDSCVFWMKMGENMNLLSAELEQEYIVRGIETDDEEMDAFLFSLGCYSGEPITVISRLKGGCVVSIKDARYTIDDELAEAIFI